MQGLSDFKASTAEFKFQVEKILTSTPTDCQMLEEKRPALKHLQKQFSIQNSQGSLTVPHTDDVLLLLHDGSAHMSQSILLQTA